jgi:hypothetical protein
LSLKLDCLNSDLIGAVKRGTSDIKCYTPVEQLQRTRDVRDVVIDECPNSKKVPMGSNSYTCVHVRMTNSLDTLVPLSDTVYSSKL